MLLMISKVLLFTMAFKLQDSKNSESETINCCCKYCSSLSSYSQFEPFVKDWIALWN
jgi:hypothetical protein